MWRIKSWILAWLEGRQLVTDKTCCACKNFIWFHGSAGTCVAKAGCSYMMDCMDTCDCGCFKKKKHS